MNTYKIIEKRIKVKIQRLVVLIIFGLVNSLDLTNLINLTKLI